MVEPLALTVTPGRGPETLSVQVFNMSTIVDRYTVELPDAPPWLQFAPTEVRLLPGKDDTMRLLLSIPAPPLVPAGQHQLTVRVSAVAEPQQVVTATVAFTVGVIEGPLALTMEPVLIRIRDTGEARLRVVAENLTSNRPVPLTLEGSDPEKVVRFQFDPPVVTVPPGGSATAAVRLLAPQPAAGQEITRQLTISATEGTREVSALGSLVQSTSAQSIRIRLEPSVVNIRDRTGAEIQLVAENPGGNRPVRLTLRGADPERLVRFSFIPPVLQVPANGSAVARVQLEAPQPDPGQEASRPLTITASDGQQEIVTTGTLNQRTTTVAVTMRLEPMLLRVRDSGTAFLQVIADNRSSARPIRMMLTGSDPERAVRFLFNPQMLEVGPGEIGGARVQLDAPLPDWGTEISRPITVQASDGVRTFEATGTFLQSSSEAPTSALTLRLDPSVVRTKDTSEGAVVAVADNRDGTAPVRVQLRGSDPERVVQFSFFPQVLDVPPGGWAASEVRMRAPRPDRGQETSRAFKISAVEDRKTVDAEGTFIQATSDRRPILRVVLTILGALMMAAAVFLNWTNSDGNGDTTTRAECVGNGLPEPPAVSEPRTGLDWDVYNFGQVTCLKLNSIIRAQVHVDDPTGLTRDLQSALQHKYLSAGIIVLVLAAAILFGLTGSRGRLTRTASVAAVVFTVAFFAALIVQATNWQPDWGAYLVVAGAVVAFVGGMFARRAS